MIRIIKNKEGRPDVVLGGLAFLEVKYHTERCYCQPVCKIDKQLKDNTKVIF